MRWGFLDRARRDVAAIAADAAGSIPGQPAGLDACQDVSPFLLSDEVVEAALDIAEQGPAAVEAALGKVVLPAEHVWIEWRSATVTYALCLHVDTTLAVPDRFRVAAGSIFLEIGDHRGPVSKMQTYWARVDLRGGAQPAKFGLPSEPVTVDERKVGAFLVAVLALIASPKVTATEERGDEAQNKRRRRLKLPPVGRHRHVTMRDVALVVGGVRRERQDPDEFRQRLAPEESASRVRHHVRAHLRLLPTAKVTVVRPHMRGDATLGTVEQRHVVRMAVEVGRGRAARMEAQP